MASKITKPSGSTKNKRVPFARQLNVKRDPFGDVKPGKFVKKPSIKKK